MRHRQIRFDRTPGFSKARARVARALIGAAVVGASVVLTASPAAAQAGDPAYGAGPGVSAGRPTTAGQVPGRAPGGPLVPAQALPNTGGGPATASTDWGTSAAVAALGLGGLAVGGRRLLARGGRAS